MLLVYIIASLMFRPSAIATDEMDAVGVHSQTLVDHSIQTHSIQTQLSR